MERSNYETILKSVFTIDKLKEEQYTALYNIIERRDNTICVLPTGFGKSLCYQFPAIYLDKPSIVISPLISLMEDQKTSLEKLGISVCCYNSNIDRKQAKADILANKYRIIYMTPEYVVKSQELLQELEELYGIADIAIDEAHCVSMWGNSFRPEYQNLRVIKEWLPDVPIVALTGTATPQVIEDIRKSLGIDDALIVKASFNRPNLFLKVVPKQHTNLDLAPYFLDHNKKPIIKSSIIYVKTRKETETLKQILLDYGIECDAYHAGLLPSQRTKIHHEFLDNKLQCIIATISFGMGIDKSDIRMVIHYGAPKDMESYYQELGRAGRDGKPSDCITFYNRSDFSLNKFFLKDIHDVKYRAHMQKALHLMEQYLYSKDCRRKSTLAYFNENYTAVNNHCCDNCEIKPEDKKVELFDTDAKILLDVVREFNDKFGISKMILILKGSKAKTIAQYIQDSKYHGKGRHQTLEFWKDLGQKLLNGELLKEKSIQGSFGCTVQITPKGLALLKEKN